MRDPFTERFSDDLAGDLAWRKKELSQIQFQVARAGLRNQSLVCRQAVVMEYAHWEGYFRFGVRRYLEYLKRTRKRWNQLGAGTRALLYRMHLGSVSERDGHSLWRGRVEAIDREIAERVRCSPSEVADSFGNLNTQQIRQIFALLDLEFDGIWLSRELQINESLVRRRNRVAHGDATSVEPMEVRELHELVITGMERFRAKLENHVIGY